MKTFTYATFIILFLLMSTVVLASENKHTDVTFLENKGQWQEEILFQGTSLSPNVYFMNDGLSFGMSGEEIESEEEGEEEHPYLVWNMKFVNPDAGLTINGINGKKSVISYLSGNDASKWIIHPMEFTEVRYTNVFHQVDLHFFGEGNNLKYDYIVHNGANINSILAYYAGVKKISLNEYGELEVLTEWEKQIQKAPVAWQEINGRKHPVVISYTIMNDSTFGFTAPNGYIKNFDLVIDPLFTMVWSTYTKATGTSNNQNYCFSNAMDIDGNVYITGMVDGTFPVTPGAYSSAGPVAPEIFVAKFSSDGTTLIYSTYLPGNSTEHGVAIAIDDSGRAYLTGIIELNITGLTNYPSTANAFQPVHDQGSDAFLTVLTADGTGLVYSSFLGGSGSETGYDVVLGPPGIAYIAGVTTIGSFPTKATSVFPSGDQDLFVAKFDINQSGNNSLIYSTRIGAGSFSYCKAKSIDVNSAGNIFITGTLGTGFGVPVYPTTAGAYETVYNPGQDNAMSFVTKLSANTPVTLDYSTLLAPGTGSCIAVHDLSGDAFITGGTNTFTFPVTAGVIQPVHGGTWGSDAFLVRMNSTGTGLVYSTFLGGPGSEAASGVVVNTAGEAYVTGIAQDSFPVSAGAIQTANAGSYDFFAVQLNADGTAYGCGGSTYIGGSDADYSGSFYDYSSPYISLQDHGGMNDTICISSTSHSQDFPTTPGVYGPVKVNGIADQPVFFKLTCAGAIVLPVAQFSAPDSICPGACIDFTNLSQNATSYLWSFPGSTVAFSTDVNPSGICYGNPGSYDVTLIAIGASGNDTVSIADYITVYPAPPPQGIMQNGDTLFANPGAVSYQWYFNGNLINGATSYFYVAQQSGDYNVVATDNNGCEVEAVINNVLADVQSAVEKEELIIFPNPVKDKLIMQNAESMIGTANEISIYNVIGEKVKTIAEISIERGVNVSNLNPGVYFLEIVSHENIFRIKFIKN